MQMTSISHLRLTLDYKMQWINLANIAMSRVLQ